MGGGGRVGGIGEENKREEERRGKEEMRIGTEEGREEEGNRRLE